MRRPYISALAACLLLIMSGLARADQKRLEAMITAAQENYPELSAARLAQAATSSRTKAAGDLPDPTLGFGLLNLPSGSFALDETPMSGIAIGLTQRIPWPGKLRARSTLSELREHKQEAFVGTLENRLAREVTQAYADYSYWFEAEIILNQYLDLLDATRSVAEIRYANGQASAHDVLRINSTVSRSRVRLFNAEQMKESAGLRLWRAVGDSSLLADLPPYLPEPTTDSRAEDLIESNPELERARTATEESRARLRLSKAGYWPDLSVGVDYRRRQNVPMDPVQGEDFVSFKVGLSLPLWFFSKQKHEVEAARRMTLAAGESERQVREILTTQLEDSRSVLNFTTQSLEQYNRNILPETEAALEAAHAAYEVGQVDFNALLAAHTDRLDSRLERLDLLRRYQIANARINEIVGAGIKR